jgi:plastocyanin
MFVAILGLAVVGSVLGIHAVVAEQPPESRHHTVSIDGTSYGPQTLSVDVGDTVVWVNKDLFPHTVTARTGAFDSGKIAPGETWRYTVNAEGVFAYFCAYHPTMEGTLRIR